MAVPVFTAEQRRIIEADPDERIRVSGRAGCGKTSAAAERVRFLLENADAWPQVLVFTPGRNYDGPYREILSRDGLRPAVTTYNSYIQNCLKLFWPLIADRTEFGRRKNFPRRHRA